MTAFDYSRAETTAQRLIERFGQSATLHRYTSSGDAWNPSRVEVDQSATVAVLAFSNYEVDGTLIKAGDKKVYVSTEGVSAAPDTDQKITIGGVKHSIMAVMPLNPGGTIVYWKLQVRK